jgi:gamma-glutamyltranspeptidase / glutathione hydrolase
MIETWKQSSLARDGMVVAAHPLATVAGLEMLSRGGNAVDAAVATLLSLSVVEPFMTGIFGGGFMLIRRPDGEVVALDNYCVAPQRARPDMFEPLAPAGGLYNVVDGLNDVGHRAVGVPGSLAAYAMAVQRYGRLDWATVLQPAIRQAEQGFPATSYLVEAVRAEAANLARFADSAKVFLPGGAPPAVGSIIRRPEYAATLRLLAQEGPAAFYRGAIARAVAEDMKTHGGLISLEDLAGYEVQERTPIRGTYRGYEIVSMAPASSGGLVLVEMLNLLEGFDVAGAGFGTPAGVHLLAEALKIGFADRRVYLGDPEVAGAPPVWLTDKRYAQRRRGEINQQRAGSPQAGRPDLLEGTCTTHVTAADGQGCVVTTTQTVNMLFGSRVTVPGTGMLLNNCMRLFDPRPGQPNSIAPGKRMLSSMTPTLVLKDGRPVLAVGTPGGTRIIAAVLQAIVNVVDHGMNVQAAIEAPRIHTGTENEGLLLEPDFTPEMAQALAAMGHPVQRVARVAGGMHAIRFHDGLLEGAACWRADGVAMGVSGGPTKDPAQSFVNP